MQGQNVVVTGGTDGIGKAAAVRLAKLAAHLLLIGRNPDKGKAAVAEIKRASGNDSVAYLRGDLSLVKNVRAAAAHIRETFDKLDVLVHCAGNIFPRRRTLTDDGLELSFAIQYMARFLLTNELIDLLRAAPAPQVLSVMGGGTISRRVDFDNLQGRKELRVHGSYQDNQPGRRLAHLRADSAIPRNHVLQLRAGTRSLRADR